MPYHDTPAARAAERYPRLLFLVLVVTLFLFMAVLTAPAALAAPAGQAGPGGQGAMAGEQLFQSRCTGCHTIGQGKLVGPDLKGVNARRDAAWIKSFISDPSRVMAANDPTAQQLLKESNGVVMPTLGLSPEEVDALARLPGAGRERWRPRGRRRPGGCHNGRRCGVRPTPLCRDAFAGCGRTGLHCLP